MEYRASRQSSIKQAPVYMLFQQHMNLSIDTETSPITNRADGSLDDTDHDVDALLELRAKSYSSANHNITYAQEKQKETYDCKH